VRQDVTVVDNNNQQGAFGKVL